jgi:hypothetical protein
MKTFKEECEEWLEPLGYSIHYHNSDYSHISFCNVEKDHMPEVICVHRLDGQRFTKLTGGGVKLFFSIVSGELQFKHPDIERFINTMQHYSKVCATNPPF